MTTRRAALMGLAVSPALVAPAVFDLKDETWRNGADIPNVKIRDMREFVVAVRRAHTGKVYSFSAYYLNAYPLRYEDCPKGKTDFSCDECEDGCPTIGWFTETGDDDDGRQFHGLHLEKGDEFLGWRNIPQWPSAATA